MREQKRIDFSPVEARWVRMYGLKRGTEWEFQFLSLEYLVNKKVFQRTQLLIVMSNC